MAGGFEAEAGVGAGDDDSLVIERVGGIWEGKALENYFCDV